MSEELESPAYYEGALEGLKKDIAEFRRGVAYLGTCRQEQWEQLIADYKELWEQKKSSSMGGIEKKDGTVNEELKPCPVCGGECEKDLGNMVAWCANKECMIYDIHIDLDDWQSRPPTPLEMLVEISESTSELIALHESASGWEMLSRKAPRGAYDAPAEAIRAAWEEMKKKKGG